MKKPGEKQPRNHPHVYEINLMTWLHRLREKEGRAVTLKDVPGGEWERIRALGMDVLWLMGMWQRSPCSKKRALEEPSLLQECRSLLPDFEPTDMAGSPYAVYDYRPDPAFGTTDDLLSLRGVLESHGLSLILDFVPNHTACDHPWIADHPGRYVQEEQQGGRPCGKGFFNAGESKRPRCVAHGRDPCFPPWTDTAQVHYGRMETWEAVTGLLAELTRYCHGFRCDMAMLALSDVFRKTWGPRLAPPYPEGEFWSFAHRRLEATGNPCLLVAEAYWGKEPELLRLGFDYAYDKGLYDLMAAGDIRGIRNHLLHHPWGDQGVEKGVHFLENHDEPRAFGTFGPRRIKAAMVIHGTLPGMRLWQEGQLEGARCRTPVQLRRAPSEPVVEEVRGFSEAFLKELDHPVFHDGTWEMLATRGWPDNASHESLLAWMWTWGRERRLVVVNFSFSAAQGYVTFPPGRLPKGRTAVLRDPLEGKTYVRSLSEMAADGLYVGLGSGDFHFFSMDGDE